MGRRGEAGGWGIWRKWFLVVVYDRVWVEKAGKSSRRVIFHGIVILLTTLLSIITLNPHP
jgi:hypothetical protein